MPNLRAYATIDREELEPYASSSRRVFAVPSQGYAVRARDVTAIGAIELESATAPQPEPEETVELLMETIRDLGGVRKALKGDVDYVLNGHSGASLPPIFDALERGDEEILPRRRSCPTCIPRSISKSISRRS